MLIFPFAVWIPDAFPVEMHEAVGVLKTRRTNQHGDCLHLAVCPQPRRFAP